MLKRGHVPCVHSKNVGVLGTKFKVTHDGNFQGSATSKFSEGKHFKCVQNDANEHPSELP